MPAIAAAINAQQLGTTKIPVPMYEYHGQADEIIPLAQDIALKQQYCAEGVPDEFVLYPSEHITTQFQAAPEVVSWLGNRFAGQLPAPSDCCDTAPRADVDGQPGRRGLHRVAQQLDAERVAHAEEARRHAQRAVRRHVQRGDRPHHPAAPERHDLGAHVHDDAQGLRDSPDLDGRTHAETALATGTASLDTSGNLHITGMGQETLQMKSVRLFGINIHLGSCQTSTPVTFPLSFSGPVSSLGDGQLKFIGTTTLPPLAHCGPIGLLKRHRHPSAQPAVPGPRQRLHVHPVAARADRVLTARWTARGRSRAVP